LPFRRTANQRAPALETVGRVNGDYLDASGMNGEVVVEGRKVKISTDGAEVGKIGSTAG
jgi:hypothetical protein